MTVGSRRFCVCRRGTSRLIRPSASAFPSGDSGGAECLSNRPWVAGASPPAVMREALAQASWMHEGASSQNKGLVCNDAQNDLIP